MAEMLQDVLDQFTGHTDAPGSRGEGDLLDLAREVVSSVVLQNPPGRAGQTMVLINPKEEVNSKIEIIRSRPVLSRAVESLKLHTRQEIRDAGLLDSVRGRIRLGLGQVRPLPVNAGLLQELPEREDFEAAVVRLGEKLRLEPASDSQIVRIIYRDPDPAMASPVVNRVANVALAFIFALVVSPSAAFLVDYWNDSLKIPEDVEQRLALPVLASIPEI